MMRVFALVAMVVASPAFADSEQWPDGPNKRFFQTLERPDAWKGATPSSVVLRPRRYHLDQVQS